jgi:hypothetical protein
MWHEKTRVDRADRPVYALTTRAVEFTTDDPEETEWRNGAYEQFNRDDSPEDSVYDNYR